MISEHKIRNLVAFCYLPFSVVLIVIVFGHFTNTKYSCQLLHERNKHFFNLILQSQAKESLGLKVCWFFTTRTKCSAPVSSVCGINYLHQRKSVANLWLWKVYFKWLVRFVLNWITVIGIKANFCRKKCWSTSRSYFLQFATELLNCPVMNR